MWAWRLDYHHIFLIFSFYLVDLEDNASVYIANDTAHRRAEYCHTFIDYLPSYHLVNSSRFIYETEQLSWNRHTMKEFIPDVSRTFLRAYCMNRPAVSLEIYNANQAEMILCEVQVIGYQYQSKWMY